MNLKTALLWFATLCVPSLSFAQTQSQGDAQLWLTTVDRSALLAPQSTPLRFSENAAKSPVIEVNDMQQFQSIDGFGFAVTGGSAELLMRLAPTQRTALLKEMFAPNGEGIHVSYIRVSIGSSDMNDHAYSYDDMLPGQTDPHLEKFSLSIDRAAVIPVLKEILAINPRIAILGSPWSAPGWMKTNDNLKGGHLKPEYYSVYAQYFVKYLEEMKAEGITIHAVTVENEPLNPKNTPSMAMFAQEEDEFIAKHLGPAFEKAGISTKIQLYDHNPDVPSYPLSILKDPEANKYVEGTAFHLYGGSADVLTDVHNEYPNKNLYLTEQSVTEYSSTPPSTIGISQPVAQVLIGATRNWSRNVLLWNLAADPNNGPHTNNGGCTGCSGAITLDGDHATRNVAYYALAHFSKFVSPGSVRIGSSELEQLATAAFLTPEGKIVLVASNTGNFAKTFSIRYHGKEVTTTLPSESVGTYVW
jgi:glucosylceramidase